MPAHHERALSALRSAKSSVQHVTIAVQDRDREDEARRLIEKDFGRVEVTRSVGEPEGSGGWFEQDD